VASTAFDNVQINAAHVPDGGSVNVAVTVIASATTAKLGYTGGTVAGAQGLTIEVAGTVGTQQLSFTSGTAVSSIAASINAVAAETGVSAVVSGTGLSINSKSLGSEQFVSVKAVTGSFATTGGSSGKAAGKDATVSINGSTAQANGTEVSYRSGSLDLQFNLHKSFNVPGNSTFTITGGGATFQLASKVTEAGKASLGLGAVATGNLGSVANGYLSSISSGGVNSLSSNNLTNTQRILDQAVKQVSELRGRLGAFQKFTIGSTVNSLGVAYENASSAQSAISDTNFASETANLTREQILSQSASTVLSQANSAPQAALSLLRGA
jgi:flagellin